MNDQVQTDSNLLTCLSTSELDALAKIKLAIDEQTRLDELIARDKAGTLLEQEVKELDQLLAYVDQLTILKARASYTLRQMLPSP